MGSVQLTKRSKNNCQGMVSVVAVIFLVCMSILATYAFVRVKSNSRHVQQYVDYTHTFEGIEAGLAQARSEIQSDGGDGFVGVDSSFEFNIGIPEFGQSAVTPLHITSMPEIEYFAYSFDWSHDGRDNNGDGIIDAGQEDAGYFSSYAVARAIRKGKVTALRSAEQIFQLRNVNVWSNALFVGSGQEGAPVNGTASIHGSAHVLGEHLSPGDVAINAFDASGSSLIHNNYDGLDSDLRNRLPEIRTTTVAGETIESLDAVLRVKKGLVALSGQSQVGTSQNTVKAVYVTDGWIGNAIDASGNPLHVHSENGFSSPYDLGERVAYPTFDNDNGLDRLSAYLDTSPAGQGLHYVHVGPMSVSTDENYYWNATTGVEVLDRSPGSDGMPHLSDLDPSHYYVWFDKKSNHLVANGRIPIEGGGLTLASGGRKDRTMHYSGKATFLTRPGAGSSRDITIEVSLLAQNLDGSTAQSFPRQNLFGFMAGNNLVIGGNAQHDIMGGFYAQNRVLIDGHANVIGTLVGTSFDLGTSVPSIYQVPALADAWTSDMRMIGDEPIMNLQSISWRELNLP